MARILVIWILSIVLLFQNDIPLQAMDLTYQQIRSGYNEKAKYYHLADLIRLKNSMPPQLITLVIPEYQQNGAKNIQKGVLITYHNYQANRVTIAGNFSQWNPIPLQKNIHGVWYTIIPNQKEMRIFYYRLNVDHIWITNPMGDRKFIPNLSKEVNVFYNDLTLEEKQARTIIRKGREVVFRFYKPGAARVSVAGDFNQWNTWHDFLKKKENGVWELRMVLAPGEYLYRFYVDDQWTLDLYNPNSRLDATGQMASRLQIQ